MHIFSNLSLSLANALQVYFSMLQIFSYGNIIKKRVKQKTGRVSLGI